MGETLICHPFIPLCLRLSIQEGNETGGLVGVVTGNCGVVRLQKRMFNSCFQWTFKSWQSFLYYLIICSKGVCGMLCAPFPQRGFQWVLQKLISCKGWTYLLKVACALIGHRRSLKMVSFCPSLLGRSAKSRCLEKPTAPGSGQKKISVKGWLWNCTNFLSECRLMVLPWVLY